MNKRANKTIIPAAANDGIQLADGLSSYKFALAIR